MTSGDFLSHVLDRVLAAFPEQLDATRINALECELREAHGGRRHYVQRRPARCKAHRLAASLVAGISPGRAIGELGVSPRHGRRLVKLLDRPSRRSADNS